MPINSRNKKLTTQTKGKNNASKTITENKKHGKISKTNSDTNKKRKYTKSDNLFKTILQNEVAAREFLNEYLPQDFKDLVDLSKITVEKESHIEDDLKSKLSDIVYSVKTKNYEKAFIYILVEHQSTVDYWIAFRLLKYTLLLLERHVNKKNNKLPLVQQMVFYNGKKIYDAPRNFCDLFTDPKMAKSIFNDDYKLINLQSMSDDEIKRQQHLSMMHFFMKNIHQRNMLKIWEEFFKNFKTSVELDKQNDYIYIKLILWYTENKVKDEDQEQLNKLILNNLPTNDGEKIVRTIADVYREEGLEKGIEKGLEKGIEKGREEGIEKGREEGIFQTAIKMFQQKLDLNIIKSVTGLSSDQLLKIQNSTQITSN